ncbi:MAG: hypothetical protein QOF88_4891, partial [Mycobacterium sp.]|nr:hypothetical protein [Mycobacterium sp.]
NCYRDHELANTSLGVRNSRAPLAQKAVSIACAETNPVQKELHHHVPAPIPLTSRPNAMRHCQLIHSFGQS